MGLSELPLPERVIKFKQLAVAAKSEAARANGAEREAFMDIAGAWQRLAHLTEMQMEIDRTD